MEADEQPVPPEVPVEADGEDAPHEQTFEEIDAIMRQLESDPSMGVKRPSTRRSTTSRARRDISRSPPSPASRLLHLQPQSLFRSDAPSPSPSPSPSPRCYHALPADARQTIMSTELEDPFIDPPPPPHSADQEVVHHLNAGEALPASDWEGTFSDDEQDKLASRANFFDGRVNELVGGLLAARLGPMERSLEGIQHVLESPCRAGPRRAAESGVACLPRSRRASADDGTRLSLFLLTGP